MEKSSLSLVVAQQRERLACPKKGILVGVVRPTQNSSSLFVQNMKALSNIRNFCYAVDFCNSKDVGFLKPQLIS